MRIKSALLLTTFIAQGCASVPSASSSFEAKALSFTPPEGMASIYVYRPKEFLAAGTLIDVSLGEKRFGTLAAGTYLFGNVEPGRYVVRGRGIAQSRVKLIRLNAEAGRQYFFKIDSSFGGARLQAVDETEGRKAIKNYKLSGDNAFEFDDQK